MRDKEGRRHDADPGLPQYLHDLHFHCYKLQPIHSLEGEENNRFSIDLNYQLWCYNARNAVETDRVVPTSYSTPTIAVVLGS